MISALLVALLAIGMTRAGGGAGRTCNGHCPPGCPMHARGIGCHQANTTKAAATRDRCQCHRLPAGGLGISAAGCQGRPDGVVTPDQPALLPAARGPTLSPLWSRCVVRSSPARTRTVDPPFRPPRLLSNGISNS